MVASHDMKKENKTRLTTETVESAYESSLAESLDAAEWRRTYGLVA